MYMTKKMKKLTVISLQIQERLSCAEISNWALYTTRKEGNAEKGKYEKAGSDSVLLSTIKDNEGLQVWMKKVEP